MIKIIVVDDQQLFRQGLVAFLSQEPDFCVAGEAGNGEEGLAIARRTAADVIITDIEMPVLNGIGFSQALREEFPAMAIIGLTLYEEDHLVADMFAAGARGYLLKCCSKEQLNTAVRTVAGKGYFFCESTSLKLSKLIAKLCLPSFTEIKPGLLTPTEIRIIEMSCQGLSNKAISATLFLGKRTIETYRHVIYKKTGVKNIAGLVIFAIRHGIFQP